MYADWKDYKETYLLGREPAIPEAEFPFWSSRASEQIDAVTFDRLKDVEEVPASVINCVCELAEYLRAMDEYKGISSVSVTGHSVTLEQRSVGQPSPEKRIISKHLASTGLLYRGIR